MPEPTVAPEPEQCTHHLVLRCDHVESQYSNDHRAKTRLSRVVGWVSDESFEPGDAQPAHVLYGFLVVRDENGLMVCDWDGDIHPGRRDAEVELETAKLREPLYEWYLAEVRRAEAGAP